MSLDCYQGWFTSTCFFSTNLIGPPDPGQILSQVVKTRRDRIRRVFKNAGHRPPIFRYSLPKFLRSDPNNGVPKELDESEDEFWSSDDELNNLGKSFENEKLKHSVYKPTPEFVPEYPAEVEEVRVINQRESLRFMGNGCV